MSTLNGFYRVQSRTPATSILCLKPSVLRCEKVDSILESNDFSIFGSFFPFLALLPLSVCVIFSSCIFPLYCFSILGFIFVPLSWWFGIWSSAWSNESASTMARSIQSYEGRFFCVCVVVFMKNRCTTQQIGASWTHFFLLSFFFHSSCSSW